MRIERNSVSIATGVNANKASAVSRVLSNAAVLLPAAGAALGFAGHSYYQRLFAAFGLKPSVVEISSIDIAARGLDAILFAPFGFVRDHGESIVWPWVPLMLCCGLAGLTFRPLLSNRTKIRLVPLICRFDRWQARGLRWLLAFLVIGLGYTAGFNAANEDVAGIQQARAKIVNCYRIDGAIIPALLLGQDKTTVVLVKARSTVVREFKAMEIVKCRTPAAEPASASGASITSRFKARLDGEHLTHVITRFATQ